VLALRVVAVLAVLAIGGALVAFLFTRDRRFLRFVWQAFKYGVIVAALVFVLLALERIAVGL
jgi:hypothetical protein